jgi:NAD+ diphosphatase
MRAGRHLVHAHETEPPRALMPRAGDAPAFAAVLAHSRWVLLGRSGGTPVLAVDLGDDPAEGAADPHDPASIGGRFAELRSVASSLPAVEAETLMHARGLLNWRARHAFCANCGARCHAQEAGHVMACPDCGTHHFPRTDPAVIMLVRNGDRALMARSARFEGRMFSALAGFVEPGESLEGAVAREVFEECGVRATRIAYHSSQPWPFPASLMLGFTAETADEKIVIDDDEIVEARWFTREDVAGREQRDFSIPPGFSIARKLIDDWCHET